MFYSCEAVLKKKKNSTLWQPRGVGWGGVWERGSRGREYMYTNGWFTLLYGRNQHDINQLSLELTVKDSVKQLPFSKNKLIK